jgi:hypothetical protein
MAPKNTGLSGALKSAKKNTTQKTKPKGIYLSEDEREDLLSILDNFGADWNLHKLIKFAISQFVTDYKDGRFKATETTQTITEIKAKK